MSKTPSRKSFIQYELPPTALEKVQGGRISQVTTMAVGEEGGDRVTTLAVGEEGGTVTTLALGEEGCGGTY
jgi:hypothetical protein